MRFRFLLAASSMSLAAAPVLAADLGTIEPLPALEPVYEQVQPVWTGFYLGALLGYGFGTADTNIGIDADVDGFQGGAYAGVNYQIDQFVVGAEADILYSGVEGSSFGVKAEQEWVGTVRGRVGLALDQFLLYGTGGVAFTEAKLSAAGISDQNNHLGWTVGGGAEALVTDNITARLEYRYSDFEDKTYNLGGADFNADLNTHAVMGGIGFKF